RPIVSYGLWLVVLLKLIVPPSLAFPTGAAWWLRPTTESRAPAPVHSFAFSYPESDPLSSAPIAMPVLPKHPSVHQSLGTWALLTWATVSLVLLGWMIFAWGRLVRKLR